jgi:hypothetical protein
MRIDATGLPDYLAARRRLRWRPGVLDCAIFMADWIVECGGQDPIADLRDAYDSEKGFRRILRREGGFVRSCISRLVRIGMTSAVLPAAGDLAAVLAPYGKRRGEIQRRPTGAIFVDGARRAVVTSDIGLVIAGEKELPLLKAWTFPAEWRNG